MRRGAMGFVDLHCHLLWALDDGVETAEEAVAAARLLTSLGFSDAAPSPHAIAEMPSHDAAVCAARRGELATLLATEQIPLRLHQNAENKLDDSFFERLEVPARRGIGESQRWALVEIPFRSAVPALPDLVFRLRRRDVLPLFAHPERCHEFERPGRAAEVVRLGGALQLNVGALTGLYGQMPRKLAEQFLDEGLYAVAATDLHRPDGADEWVPDAMELLEKRGGSGTLERLFASNPRRVLAGEELE
jgi:protein-tyrosine phosphatase